ncbi:putative F-box domain-containing protein [Helianthus annuus]|nr:putative F-box domain-containing protein [Helianthus annuus]
MSDNIPFEIQSEIIKRLPVISLIQFRTVSKPWKSLIDSSPFINHYSTQNTQIHRLLVTYDDPLDSEKKYVSIADDDDTFPHQKLSYSFPLLAKLLQHSSIIGTSHGLVCLYGSDDSGKDMAVVCNLSIRKAVGVIVPNLPSGTTYGIVVGFGVCGETIDPKIVKITYIIDRWIDIESITSIPWQVEVFTLSTGAWRAPFSNSLPSRSFHFNMDSVVIDGVLYWLALDGINTGRGRIYYNLIVTFDLTSEEFGEIHLPDSLANTDDYNLSISKVRKSLVVIKTFMNDEGFGVWVMLDSVPKSFVRIFTIKSPDLSVKGFRKNGELIIESVERHPGQRDSSVLVAFDPDSKDINDFEINASAYSFCVYPHIETLLLLDQPDFVIYDQGKATLQSGELQA